VDIVFGMLVLHHVNLALAAAEVARVLKPGGRAIFTEPIRNSKLLGAIRNLIPYRQPAISPFERPLRFDEIDTFSERFRGFERRVFDLPPVRLLRVCRANPRLQSWTYARDAQLLRRWPRLAHFAAVMVFQVTK
jgi:SAM-dependent methyltransferase